MRASWHGYVRVADVMFPVRLFAGVRSVNPQYVRLHAKDHSPVSHVVTCQKDGQELQLEDIVRAVVIDGKYIEISDTDITVSGATDKNITVRQFSQPSEIDPAYYEKSYYIVPGKGGELMYTILRQAFIASGKVAVVTYVFYEKEHLGIIRTVDGMLQLQQLRFAEEIVPRQDIDTPSLPQPLPADVEVAAKLMDRYSSSFFIDDYQNDQLNNLNEIIERKAKGLPPKRQVSVASETTPEDEVVEKLKALLGSDSAELRSI